MQSTQPFRSAMFKLPSYEYGMEAPQTKLAKQWSIQQTPVLTPINNPSVNTPILNLMPSPDFLDLNAGTGCNIVDNPNQYYDESSDDNNMNNMNNMNKMNKMQDDECKSDKSFKTISSSSPSSKALTESTENESYTESEIAKINDEVVLARIGYQIIGITSHTKHGCVYKAKIMKVKDNDNQVRNSFTLNSQRASKASKASSCFNVNQFQHVAIKKVDKQILQNHDKDPDENIMKEAIILHYLSVMNRPPADNLCDFVNFIETDSDYYLVEEYGGIRLGAFIKTAHQYIRQKKLKLKNWRICVKFLFWQLTVMVHWLHHDMHVCHLDLTVDNILIKNAAFLEDKNNGSITIDATNIKILIIDWGFSEIFPFNNSNNNNNDNNNDNERKEYTDNHTFECAKNGKTSDHIHKSPQRLAKGLTFNAVKDDCYSMGVILYEMLMGLKPYSSPNPDKDNAYLALQKKELQNYLINNGLSKHVYRSTLSLLEGLIEIDEEERFNTQQILKHEWFTHYYKRYKLRIQHKTKSQYERHQRQAKKMKILPYYSLPNDNTKHCCL